MEGSPPLVDVCAAEDDLDIWSAEKKVIHATAESKLYHKQELWWCSLGTNIGLEQNGTGEGYQRPVLIVAGMSKDTCYVIPLTTSTKRHRLRIPIDKVAGKAASAIVSQMRLIDTKRLVNKIGYLDDTTFDAIRKAVRELF